MKVKYEFNLLEKTQYKKHTVQNIPVTLHSYYCTYSRYTISTLSLYNRHKSLSPIAPLAINKKARPVSKEFVSCETWKQRLKRKTNL